MHLLGTAAPQLQPPDCTQQAHAFLDALKLQGQPVELCVQRSIWPATETESVFRMEFAPEAEALRGRLISRRADLVGGQLVRAPRTVLDYLKCLRRGGGAGLECPIRREGGGDPMKCVVVRLGRSVIRTFALTRCRADDEILLGGGRIGNDLDFGEVVMYFEILSELIIFWGIFMCLAVNGPIKSTFLIT